MVGPTWDRGLGAALAGTHLYRYIRTYDPLLARSLWPGRRLAPGPVKAAPSSHKTLHLVSGRAQLPHAMLTKGMVRQTWGSQGSGVGAPW